MELLVIRWFLLVVCLLYSTIIQAQGAELIAINSDAIKLFLEGRDYQKQEEKGKALDRYNKALKLCATNNDSLKAVILNEIGYVNKRNGDYLLALNNYQKAFRIRDSIQDKWGMAYSLNSIGNIYQDWESYEKAINYFKRALVLEEEIEDKKGVAYTLNNLGIVYEAQGNPQKAMEHYQESLKIDQEANNKKGIAYSKLNIGRIYEQWQNYEKMLTYYWEASELFLKLNDVRGITRAQSQMASAYVLMNNLPEAGKLLEKSTKAARELKMNDELLSNYKNWSKVYEGKGEYRKAYQYAKRHIKLAKIVFNEQQHKHLAEMEGKFKSEQQETEINLLKREKDINLMELAQKEEQVAQQRLLICSGIGILTVVLLAIIWVWWLYADKRRANKLLEKQKQRIEQQANQLEHNNKELEKLSIVASKTDNVVVIFDSTGEAEWANAHFTSLYGYTLEELMKNKGSNILDMSGKDDIREIIKYSMFEKKAVTYILPIEAKDGKEIWIQTTLTPILNSSGEIHKMVAIDHDISALKEAEQELFEQKKKSDKLLLNILPETTAEELKTKGFAIPRHYDSVTVLFADFQGFTKTGEQLPPGELVEQLNEHFVMFDLICEQNNLEKIKTIGDAYMCAGGLPVVNETHAFNAVLAGMKMQAALENLNEKKARLGLDAWELRLGIHTGEVVAGVVGKRKFAYDIWGDCVNVASRMEAASEAGKVNISESTYELVKEQFDLVPRGKIIAKNKGKINMYYVKGLKPEFANLMRS